MTTHGPNLLQPWAPITLGRGGAVPAYFRTMDWAVDFENNRRYFGAVYPTDTHPSPILMPDATGAWVSKAANVLCREQGVGMQGVPTYQQYAANPQAPANQTVTLSATGTYTLWIEGTGSVAVAAGTAVGTGFGSATAGNKVTFTLSAGGTVDLTVTGTVTLVNVINKAFVLPPIYSVSSITGNRQVVDLTGRLGSGVAGFIKVDVKNTGASGDEIFTLNDGTLANRIIFRTFPGPTLGMQVVAGGVDQAIVYIESGTYAPGVRTVAFAAGLNFFLARSVGGAAPTADTSGTYPTISTANFGGDGFGATRNIYQHTLKAALRFGPVDQTVFDEVFALAELAAA